MFSLADLKSPIILAPLAGGPATPALTAAVCNAGGFAFLAAGYRSAEQVREAITETRRLTARPFGVNLFCPPAGSADAGALAAYISELSSEAERYHTPLGEPRLDSDGYEAKLECLVAERIPVVSFTFGCPTTQVVERLHSAETSLWVTVTDPAEAITAAGIGVDALIVQGFEAGGHRASFADQDGSGEVGLLPLLRLVTREVDLPLIASGGIGDGFALAAAIVAGASAAQLGTAFLRAAEAGTSGAHRSALRQAAPTALTRAFTGRRARGIRNGFMERHPEAPSAYPQINHLTAPLRAVARERGDPDMINLWAGQAYTLGSDGSAAEIYDGLMREMEVARASLRQ